MRPATTYSAIVGRVLCHLRGDQFLQDDVANVAGVSQGTWSRIEQGSISINMRQLFAVRAVLGPPGSILGLADRVVELARQREIEVGWARAVSADFVEISLSEVDALVALAATSTTPGTP